MIRDRSARQTTRIVPPSVARALLAALLFTTAAAAAAAAGGDGRLLRYADIHENTIAFVYAGDIWTVPAAGGAARRLTTDVGLELFPKFSPDGRWIAFSAEYGGNRQVWVISVDGGPPRQLTFYNDVGPMPPRGGFDYRVLDWTPDGQHVLVRANRLPWGVRMGRYFLVPFEGGMARPLPVPEGGGGMLSPDGRKLVYTPIDREFRTWKRHRGGRAQDVWIFDLESIAAEQITADPGTDNQPLWVGERIYFTSDREGRLNLYSWDPATRTSERVTSHEDFDVLWPSAGPRQIVYECGGWLYRLDPARGEPVRVPVELTGDFRQTLPVTKNVTGQIEWLELSPSGSRALIAARGELFTVPARNGEIRNVSRSQGVREMYPSWSPDGRHIAYVSDRSGEYEIYVRAQDGSGEERRLTSDGGVWRFAPAWSPDSSKLAFADRDQRLRYLDVESGEVVDVDRSRYEDIRTYSWSPDSRWLAYPKEGANELSSIYVYSLDEREATRLTGPDTNDYSPAFDPKGRYLYFLSDRDWNLTFSGYEFNYLYTDPTRIYAAALNDESPALLRPKSDEETPDGDAAPDENGNSGRGEAKSKKKSGGSADGPPPVKIDIEDFERRVVALPGAPGRYRSLNATEEGLLYLSGGGRETKLQAFMLEDEETKTILEGISAYALSVDGKKILYALRDSYGIVDNKPGQKPTEGRLDLSGLTLEIDPRAEWRQIFDDAWRITRDWFYDPGMHGIDWAAMRELYGPLVEHVSHRADLDYILGEMGGELNAGHFYVNWGDMPRPERVEGGLLGAEIVAADGYFRVGKIFPGENWQEDFRSPLTEPGVDIEEGDYILAVDGRSTQRVANFYRLLDGRAGRAVELLVNDGPDESGARTVTVRPVPRETNLRYLDWVRSRKELVDRLSGGRIGYIHLPNTAAEGNRELRKGFYPQARKEALIVDVRYNGGGFIPDRMIELLARTQLSFWKRRGTEPDASPGFAHVGPKACLINGYSSSGGDAFPYYFRKLGLGKLIGTRTWGGLIGISGNPSFVDGGSLNVPTFRFLDTEGRWAVENEGVSPDIEVVDRPDLVARGADPTLEEAVRVLLAELERDPQEKIEVPEAPRYER